MRMKSIGGFDKRFACISTRIFRFRCLKHHRVAAENGALWSTLPFYSSVTIFSLNFARMRLDSSVDFRNRWETKTGQPPPCLYRYIWLSNSHVSVKACAKIFFHTFGAQWEIRLVVYSTINQIVWKENMGVLVVLDDFGFSMTFVNWMRARRKDRNLISLWSMECYLFSRNR